MLRSVGKQSGESVESEKNKAGRDKAEFFFWQVIYNQWEA